jgi:hypothetical protein
MAGLVVMAEISTEFEKLNETEMLGNPGYKPHNY